MSHQQQLTLALTLDDSATFDNFFIGENIQLYTQLKKIVSLTSSESFIFLWGNPGSGRSHLLQACCHALFAHTQPVMYLSLADTQLQPSVLQDLGSMTLICLDDLHAVIGQAAWEEALFHCYNQAQDNGSKLIVSADLPPRQLPCQLADLSSRLNSGLLFQVRGLSDSQKLITLQLRASRRGLTLSDDAGQFLLHHYSRDMRALFVMLERLDQASLVEKRRLTIPFLKKVLNKSI